MPRSKHKRMKFHVTKRWLFSLATQSFGLPATYHVNFVKTVANPSMFVDLCRPRGLSTAELRGGPIAHSFQPLACERQIPKHGMRSGFRLQPWRLYSRAFMRMRMTFLPSLPRHAEMKHRQRRRHRMRWTSQVLTTEGMGRILRR